MASGPNMLWDCVTCYQCQEHCPQQVKVTDILYELKNMAVEKWKDDETTDNHEAKVQV
jgi:heterodisulfide reductase subunit C